MSSEPPDLSLRIDPPADIAAAFEASRAARGPFGAPLFYFRSIGSTNDLAGRLADGGAGEGTTVAAETQTSGRGRLGRAWYSPEGAGLYVSVVIRPDRETAGPDAPPPGVPPHGVPSALTLAAGVALAEAVREATGLAAELKWPNDLVVRRRKLAGILAEASSRGGAVEHVILGFGVNVKPAAYPADLADRVTSLEAELGHPVDRGALLALALAKIGEGRETLRSGGLSRILARWRELAPSSVGARVEWRRADGPVEGRTAGLDGDGALLVEARGRVERVVAGEVIWR
ncbi:MAG TPA: biotin--[acetyl-CoA-carboxylase] ligase [Vicinamibacterales bacterium]|nr:biotin--[acetyl-CoA-carboxylase] ligase [Vicinamibacterales bacterium]